MAAQADTAMGDLHNYQNQTASSGASVLVIVGEPFTGQHKDLILERVTKGFKCWDTSLAGCDINAELSAVAAAAPVPEEGQNDEKEVHHASDNLQLVVLVNPQVATVREKLRAFLKAPAGYNHLVYAGHAIQGSGEWVLQDGLVTCDKLTSLAREAEVEAALKGQEGLSLTIYTHAEGPWSSSHMAKEPLGKLLRVSVNPDDKIEEMNGVIQFSAYLTKLIRARSPKELLHSSDVVGNIRFNKPTLYIFTGCQGDSSLFGISGFNLLVNGGYSRKACFWDFTRHLDRIDAMLLTHLGADNMFGAGTMLERKAAESIHPEIGHIYFNASDKGKHSPNGDATPENGGYHKPASLLVNLVEEGDRLTENIRTMGLTPSPCTGTVAGSMLQPVSLYHKVGHGTLNMFILNPLQDSKELKDFYVQWNKHVNHFTSSKSALKVNGKEAPIPLPNMVSICALLVWQPSNPNEKITRILFPGNAPQNKVFEGMDKLKNQEMFNYAEVSHKILHAPKGAKKGAPAKSGKASPPRSVAPVAKVEPKKRAPTPTKIDKHLKNGKKAGSGKVSKASSTSSQEATSGGGSVASNTPTGTPQVSSVEPSPTKEAPVIAAAAATVAAAAPAAPLAEEKPVEPEPAPVKQDNLLDLTPEEPKVESTPDLSPAEPVTASVSDTSPEPPPEPPSSDLLDLHDTVPKQDSQPEAQQSPAEVDLLGSAPEPVEPTEDDIAGIEPEPEPIDVKQIELTEQASMPEADQQSEQGLVPPAADTVMESPEPLPDPSHYEPEQFAEEPVSTELASKPPEEPFVPEEVKAAESQSEEPEPAVEQPQASEVDIVEQATEPDLLTDKRQEIMDISPESEKESAMPLEDAAVEMAVAAAPDIIPKEPELLEQDLLQDVKRQMEENQEMMEEFDTYRDKPELPVDDEKDIDTTEIQEQEPSFPVANEQQMQTEEPAQIEEPLAETQTQMLPEVPTEERTVPEVCNVGDQLSEEAYREKLAELGIYDDESELPNGEASHGSTPSEEEAAVAKQEIADVHESQATSSDLVDFGDDLNEQAPFDGEKPVGLPSPEEPPMDLEHDNEPVEIIHDKPVGFSEHESLMFGKQLDHAFDTVPTGEAESPSEHVPVEELPQTVEEPHETQPEIQTKVVSDSEYPQMPESEPQDADSASDHDSVKHVSDHEDDNMVIPESEKKTTEREETEHVPVEEPPQTVEEPHETQPGIQTKVVPDSEYPQMPESEPQDVDSASDHDSVKHVSDHEDDNMVIPESEKKTTEREETEEQQAVQQESDQEEDNIAREESEKKTTEEEATMEEQTVQQENEETELKTMEQLYEQIRKQQGSSKESSPETCEITEPGTAKELAMPAEMEPGGDVPASPNTKSTDEFVKLEEQIAAEPTSVEEIDHNMSESASDDMSDDIAEYSPYEAQAAFDKSYDEDAECAEQISSEVTGKDEEPETERVSSLMETSAGATGNLLEDSLYDPPELQPQPEPQKPESNEIPNFGTNPFSLVDTDDCQPTNTNPFVGLGDTLLQPQAIPGSNGPLAAEPHDPNLERDSLEREEAEAFDPIKTWGQPMGLPAPPPPSGNKPAAKPDSASKNGTATKSKAGAKKPEAKKPPTSPPKATAKKLASADAKPTGKTTPRKEAAANGTKKPPSSADATKKPAAKDAAPKRASSAGTAKKPRPASTPAPPKSVSKPASAPAKTAATKKTAPAAKAAPAAKPLPPVTPFYVDLTYIPNHGEGHYVDLDFFRRVRARYYVLSALETSPHVLNALLEGKQTWENPEAEVTVIPTYDTETLRSWMVCNRDQLSQLKIDVAPSASRCTIQLQDHETSCAAFRLEF